MSTEIVTLELSADEALVLFDFASRFTDQETLSIQHPGEEAALWHLTAALEKTLV